MAIPSLGITLGLVDRDCRLEPSQHMSIGEDLVWALRAHRWRDTGDSEVSTARRDVSLFLCAGPGLQVEFRIRLDSVARYKQFRCVMCSFNPWIDCQFYPRLCRLHVLAWNPTWIILTWSYQINLGLHGLKIAQWQISFPITCGLETIFNPAILEGSDIEKSWDSLLLWQVAVAVSNR